MNNYTDFPTKKRAHILSRRIVLRCAMALLDEGEYDVPAEYTRQVNDILYSMQIRIKAGQFNENNGTLHMEII